MYAIATLSLPLAPRSADNFPRQCFNFAPLLRTARSRPTTFFSPPSVAPSTRREGLGADDKMLKLSPLLAFFAPSLEDRWKPLEPSSRASRSCLKCIRLFTLASRVHSFVIPRQANHFYLDERTESLTVRFKFELIFPPVLFLSRRRERSSGVVNSFWWSERDFFALPSPLGRDKLLRTTKMKRFCRGSATPRPRGPDDTPFRDPLGTCQNPSIPPLRG